MINVLMAGLGGFIGAASRYGIGKLVATSAVLAGFPFATLIVNGTGSLVIGFSSQYFQRTELMGSSVQIFVMVGILGGFTTFSSFSLETLELLGSGKLVTGILNILLNLSICLVFVAIGAFAGKAN